MISRPINYWFLLLALASPGVLAEEQRETRSFADVRENGLNDEELRALAEKKREYSDDPQALEQFEKLQRALDVSDEDIARAQQNESGSTADTDNAATSFEADPRQAEQAYRDGDYETAQQHYEALAAEGDGYANLMLGLMHHQGQGVDADLSKARAYYERAADYGEERGRELNNSLEHEMSEQQIEESSQSYSELIEQQRKAGAPAAPERDEPERYRRVIIENEQPTGPGE
ncbi:TPR repeat protein [Methylohalomonas lacus]|uniref:TPR repeat protein n=1 Tax=Methylohalomonas lacus TaxID=398773 RepID=A0AAE3HK28_9GAMM|nr:hypothetical protein [Methylohalomonas lacus]MCS3903784.1 TPR repeat protein [Methylohalomonas lacus]